MDDTLDMRALFHASSNLSRTSRVILLMAATSLEPTIPFRKLPIKVQARVRERVQYMAVEQKASTLFDQELVDKNPAPRRVENHWKWRATRPALNRLEVPRFALECDLVWAAYPTRDLSRVDIGDLVKLLRVYSGVKSLIDFVGEAGIEALSGVIQMNIPRISGVR